MIALRKPPLPDWIRSTLTASGYDPDLTAELTYVKDVKTQWAGEDYDPHFEHSQPGDYRDVPQPGRIQFTYWRGQAWEPVTLFISDTP